MAEFKQTKALNPSRPSFLSRSWTRTWSERLFLLITLATPFLITVKMWWLSCTRQPRGPLLDKHACNQNTRCFLTDDIFKGLYLDPLKDFMTGPIIPNGPLFGTFWMSIGSLWLTIGFWKYWPKCNLSILLHRALVWNVMTITNWHCLVNKWYQNKLYGHARMVALSWT